MTSACDLTEAVERPIWHDMLHAGRDLETFPAHAAHHRQWDDGCVKQNVPIPPLFRQVEPDAIAAQPLVSPNFSNRVFDGVAEVVEIAADNDSHYRFPAFEFAARGNSSRGAQVSATVLSDLRSRADVSLWDATS